MFISYRDRDGRDLARRTASALRACGVPVWPDRRDLLPGDTTRSMRAALAGGFPTGSPSGASLTTTTRDRTWTRACSGSGWAADSDVGQPAGEPPVADREPTDDVELVDPATARRRYYAKVSGIVEEYQRVARLNQSRNDWLQWLVIGFSAGTTALAGVAAAVADWRMRIVPIVTSAIGAIAAGLTAYHEYGAQRLSKQRVVAAQEAERQRALELEQPPAKPGDQPPGQAGPG